MKRIFAFGSLFLAATVLTPLSPVHAQTDEQAYQEKLQKVQQSIADLQAQLKQARHSKSDLEKDLATTEMEIGKLTTEVKRIETELAEEKKRLALLHEQRASLNIARKTQQHHLSQQARAAYQLGGQSQVKLLLNQDDPTRASRMMKYYQYFIEARSNKIDGYIETVKELNQLEPRIQQQADTFTAKKKALETQQRQLRKKSSQRKQTLARLNANISSKDAELQKLERDKAELHRLLEQVAELLENIPVPGDHLPFAQLTNQLHWPARGKIRHKYGSNRAIGKLKWDGVTISAPIGTDVKAIHGGRVVFADWLRGQGLLMIVDHGGGYMSLYGHNQTLLKEPGDWVSADEVIAQVGNSGGQARSGLYFEIRHKGKPQNPNKWCKS
ncbi:murein hydrolase activator EnvC family protein [Marinibactrum halimedae]|uniref:M23ase beta-sheet core domain-containing protein n=1 Tax=Marinibactrum halimedae TaxID=1444977 RepID=A0AA37T4U3_9GAMM|nr:peptidoglycan DD-metalloendopeptidase family protein [Marinibactrum halimedae]MCD9459314.1 peptidoglycan DD-metalloendopeptidase family protein [Marinibactrum halimedae]GLS25794.1 hypothetical protein GCM10007877_15080 [Marinibactrum halimedae]